MAKENKIKYGIKNAHIAKQYVDEEGNITYGTPVSLPGSVSLSLDAEGEISTFYADDVAYYIAAANNGYSGDLEVAYIPTWFREDILGDSKDDSGVITESANQEAASFALLFEFEGDQKAVRRVLYNCTCTRPSMEGETKEDTIEPGTETLSITAPPLQDGKIKAQTTPDTTDTVYNEWYKTVYGMTMQVESV